MSADYIYAGTYAHTLQRNLLTQNQRELLVACRSLAEIKTVLQDTFAATAFAKVETSSDYYAALESVLSDTKAELHRVTPDPYLLQVIWLQYDFYNLKHLIKDTHVPYGQGTRPEFTALGYYPIATLKAAITDRRLAYLDDRLRTLTNQFLDAQSRKSIDAEADRLYLLAAYDIAEKRNSHFTRSYVVLMIDLFNLRSRLRTLSSSESKSLIMHDMFVPHGNIPSYKLETIDDTLKQLHSLGSRGLWDQAIASYQANHDFTDIDTTADNYLLGWLKQKSLQIHSEASLFAYFYSVRENTQFIRAVITACNTGIDELTLRRILRKSLTSYAY